MSRESRPGQSRPTAVIVIASDERRAEILIEGHRQVVTGQAPRETRRAALDVATGYAARIGQPVLIDARDANGYWHLVATPDGVVQAADQAVSGRAPAPAPPTILREEGSGGRKRALVIVGAAVLALVLLGGTGAVVWRLLPGSEAASGPGATADVTTLNHPAPPGFAGTVDFSRELAPSSQPGVSREGDMLAYVDPQERLNLLGAEGERRWSAELPVAAGEVLGAPRFVEYGGEAAVVMETAGTLWFWPTAGGSPSSVEIPEDTSAQYAGTSVLVRNDQDAFVPVGEELRPVEVPEGSAPMLAEGEDVLTAVLNGPWTWVGPDDGPVEVNAQRPERAGEMESVVTALREYVIVRWEPLQGEGTLLAFHDSRDGSVVGSVEVDPADLEGVRHRSGPIGTDLVAYGPAVLAPESGRSAAVPGFEPDITVGSRVFGRLDGALVAVDAEGEVEEAEEGSVQPSGLLGERAVVVHDDHLYAIPSE
ncbi:hypothetical protein [Nocardiopsis quinghaiensis]|uniref:hypothetical protein n=1 Tax=Nocardiopsis quinghaiensis TaxID=464995 RepID=UPI00123AE880|nr:hypothetical protein [Nocardiopsis quinghaiensis]